MQLKRLLRGGPRRLVFYASQGYFSVFGSRVECNICHYKANRLASDDWHLYCTCPHCRSEVRHRLLFAALTLGDFHLDRIIRQKRVLHFAPEVRMSKRIREAAGRYQTADLLAEGYRYENIDFHLDISKMTPIADGSIDCVIACDVLEHVPRDIEAMHEIHRVLSRGGWCILTVPQKDRLPSTFEDPRITDPAERTRIFGQSDHLRIYGDDFPEVLKDCGFEVTAVDEHYFDERTVRRNVLFPPVLSDHPLATNHRKIFFGRKHEAG